MRQISVQRKPKVESKIGLLVALVLVFLWISSLVILLTANLADASLIWIVPAILGRTFIQTGLFIVAHDAIHGSVISNNRPLNDWIGSFMVTMYALLPYKKLTLNHWKHHRHPGQLDDPDFHDGVHSGFFAWYLNFMMDYVDAELRRKLFWYMTIAFLILRFGLNISGFNILLFWLLPLVLSSIQLFFFGTYLPHRSSNIDSRNPHRAVSSNYPPIWSFFSCYHFGYHWEHHEYPDVAWYDLPGVHQSTQRMKAASIFETECSRSTTSNG
ncbi:MAG: beta-carotene ketolase [Leptolyngbya sp.]|nr:MAG: beta-carotene ketolase [Leptolyngbya sp.]